MSGRQHRLAPALFLLALGGAGLLLCAAAWMRGPEYDEAYSIFLTAGHARPAWPQGVFTAGSVRWIYQGYARLWQIARDLRAGDVHPPLYFWVLEIWRQVTGPGWFTARLLSVLFTLAGLLGLARLAAARRLKVLPVLAMALLSYGFCYTGILIRPFALAQALNIWGVVFALRRERKGLAAGLCFGAAAFTDYLACFTGFAVLAWLGWRAPKQAGLALLAMLPFLAACFWFFLGQHGSRSGQFPVFAWHLALASLARDGGASLFGGLPLYAGKAAGIVSFILALLAFAGLALALRQRSGCFFLALAAATPCGLLALGVIFHNTPIEIRYLSFGLPFLALAIAPVLPLWLLGLWLGLQAVAVAGMMLAQATMQPQGHAAALASLYPGRVVAVPFGNDGVGVPGPFIAAAADGMRIILLHPGDEIPPNAVRAAIGADEASRNVAARMNCQALVCGN